MDTYDESLAPCILELLSKREIQLRSVLQAGQATRFEDHAHEVEDFKDLATDSAMEEIEDMKAGQAAAELERVIAAKSRLEQGLYGSCLNCGQPVDLRRLLTLPAASFCTSCQSDREKKDRTHMRRPGS